MVKTAACGGKIAKFDAGGYRGSGPDRDFEVLRLAHAFEQASGHWKSSGFED